MSFIVAIFLLMMVSFGVLVLLSEPNDGSKEEENSGQKGPAQARNDPEKIIATCRKRLERAAKNFGDDPRAVAFEKASEKLLELLEGAYARLEELSKVVPDTPEDWVGGIVSEADAIFPEVNLSESVGNIPDLLRKRAEDADGERRRLKGIIERVFFLSSALVHLTKDKGPLNEFDTSELELLGELSGRLGISSPDSGSVLNAFLSYEVHQAIVGGEGLGLNEPQERREEEIAKLEAQGLSREEALAVIR